MKLEVGKFYKARNGELVKILAINEVPKDYPTFPPMRWFTVKAFYTKSNYVYMLSLDGKDGIGIRHEHVIVEEWSDQEAAKKLILEKFA